MAQPNRSTSIQDDSHETNVSFPSQAVRSTSTCAADLARLTRETADGLKQSLGAGQPITTKLIVTGMAERLRDEHVIADLVQRSMAGENAFAALTREIIREEAEQIAQSALAASVTEVA